ncbi:MAG TPA: NAD(P)-dependent oxidoreductase [Myxococcaceae bacterium]|jgi:3-hydroxyisobutyrate dehydrogenase
MTKIAFLGLGAMGSRMARNLLSAGHTVSVWNRSPQRAAPLVEAGASLHATPRAAVTGAQVVCAMLTDDEASRDVWLNEQTGALAGMAEGSLAVEHSTLTPGWVKTLGARAASRGVRFVDAPVAGSRPQAEARQLLFLVGGEAGPVEELRPLLSAMGAAVHHLGPMGAGAAMKLAVNALFGIQIAAMAEVLSLLEKSGIEASKAVETLGAMPVTSLAAKGAGALIAARKFDPLFPIALVEKDFRYIAEAGRAVGSRTPTADAARALYQEAIAAGHGGDNIHGVAKLYG